MVAVEVVEVSEGVGVRVQELKLLVVPTHQLNVVGLPFAVTVPERDALVPLTVAGVLVVTDGAAALVTEML
jgi:hypothetical protein